ncbi:MAG: tetratricopeptide repeat protein [Gammaproteobacteria bacterium]
MLCAVSATASPALERAKILLNDGKPQAALAELQPLRGVYAGEPEFDYALALALLDSGDGSQATLIFERLLLVQPDFHGARIDLGRAYLGQARLIEARREFEKARAAGPPPAAAKVVDDYITRIDRAQRRAKFSRYLSVGTRAGYDSNVNSATELDEFLGFTLNAQSREQNSDFLEAGIAAGGAYALRPQLVLSGRLSSRWRRNGQASFADSNVISASTRLMRKAGRQEQSISLQGFTQSVDGRRNSTALLIAGDWRFGLGNAGWLGPQVQFGSVRFEDALEIKDVNRWSIGMIGGLRFGPVGQGGLQASAGVGGDDPQRDGSRFGRDFWRLDSNLTWAFSDTLNVALGVGVEQSRYDNVFFESLFTEAREDTTWRSRGAVDWQFAPRWRLQHSLSYRVNETDVTVFEFDRFEATLGVRYVWR